MDKLVSKCDSGFKEPKPEHLKYFNDLASKFQLNETIFFPTRQKPLELLETAEHLWFTDV